MDIGPTELIIALVVILLLFGGKKLPEIARGLGRAQHEFKEGMQNPGASRGGVDRLDHTHRGTADPRHGVGDFSSRGITTVVTCSIGHDRMEGRDHDSSCDHHRRLPGPRTGARP